jgi:hypothetical protein
LALVPAANLFNHRILHAEPFGPVRSLQIFDLAGISFYSADLAAFGPGTSFTRDEVTRCYAPEGWDRLAPWGECRLFWNRLAVSRDLQGILEKLDVKSVMGATPNPDLPDLWTAAIVRHPLAYVGHRLAYFSSEIGRGASMAMPDAAAQKPLDMVLYDLMTASALWLAIGAGLLVQLAVVRSVRRTASIDAALALVLSGLSYAGAYLIIGIATELRYLFWSLIAIFTALVISLPELWMPSGPRRRITSSRHKRSVNNVMFGLSVLLHNGLLSGQRFVIRSPRRRAQGSTSGTQFPNSLPSSVGCFATKNDAS